MNSPTLVAQALGIAYAAGINLPATVAILGLLQHAGWIGALPGGLGVLASWWIVGLALVLTAMDFIVTLVPGVGSAWATVLTVVRPLAGAVLALGATAHLDPVVTIAAALLGGGLALGTHGAVTATRYTLEASPEPVTNFAANVAALSSVAAVCLSIWRHPYLTLAIALAALALVLFLLHRVLRGLRRLFGRPGTAAAPR